MRSYEADLCIVGAGITGTMLAAKLAQERQLSIVVVEAGDKLFDLEKRFEHRQRYLDYGENWWPGDFIEDQAAEGIISRTMAAGGQALHWAATAPRYSREDFRIRSLYGVGGDWPVSYEELEPYYCEAERRIGVAGAQGPESEGWDPRSEPYPMEAFPLDYNQKGLRDWASKAGLDFRVTPTARNTRPYDGRMQCTRCGTCNICPTGAKYSPDFTLQSLLEEQAIELVPNTLVRRLDLDERGRRVERARAVDRVSGEPVEIRARTFALAGGYTWTPHLLLLSASSRSPDGVANASGLVGRYMCGHRPIWALIEVPVRIYPGLNISSMITRRFMKPPPGSPYIRHDLALFTHTYGRQPRLRDDTGDFFSETISLRTGAGARRRDVQGSVAIMMFCRPRKVVWFSNRQSTTDGATRCPGSSTSSTRPLARFVTLRGGTSRKSSRSSSKRVEVGSWSRSWASTSTTRRAAAAWGRIRARACVMRPAARTITRISGLSAHRPA